MDVLHSLLEGVCVWILCSIGNGDVDHGQLEAVGFHMPHGFEDTRPAYFVDLQDRKEVLFDMC